MKPVLIIRAQPGAGETAARAAALGLDVVVAPLFAAQPIASDLPEMRDFDAVMLTSAQAARHAGPALAACMTLPCYAVGESTAAAARRAGFADLRTGSGGGEALLAQMAGDDVTRVLHLCGRNRKAYARPGITITRQTVYAVDGFDALPQPADAALRQGAVVLLHSPRAAAHFANLCDAAGIDRKTISIAAISSAAAEAAGQGWKRTAVAKRPRDEPLLELAAKLCKTGSA